MEYFLGLDIGTTNCKAVLLDESGQVQCCSTKATPTTDSGRNDWTDYDPEQIFSVIVDLIVDVSQRVSDPRNIRAMSISSMGETGVPVDEAGNAVYPAIAWFDPRTVSQMQLIEYTLGDYGVYSISGLPMSTSYGLLKLMWLKEERPECFSRVRRWLPIGSYVAFRLTGIPATDQTLAWRTMAYDINHRGWSDDLLAAAGIDSRIMGDIIPSGKRLAHIKSEISSYTGIPKDCWVVSGGMDAVCGMVAVGAVQPGIVFDVMGTSEIFLTTLKEKIISEKGMKWSLDIGPHIFGDHYLIFGSMTASGAAVEWFINLFRESDEKNEFDRILSKITDEARKELPVKSSVFVLPHLRGSRTPFSDLSSRSAFLGVDINTNRGQLFIGLLEGICWDSRLVMDAISEYTGIPVTEVWVSGGCTKNDIWMSLKSKILEKDLHLVTSPSISAHGAAILAAYGANQVENLETVIDRMRPSTHTTVNVSVSQKGIGRNFSNVYREMYSDVKKIQKKIGKIRHYYPGNI